MNSQFERIELNPIEIKRTYNFPKGEKVSYENVVALFKNDRGTTGRIQTLNDGKLVLHIIKPDWLTIDIEASDFTV